MGKFYFKVICCLLLLVSFRTNAQTSTVTLNADPKAGPDGTTFDLSGQANVGTFGGGSFAFPNSPGSVRTATVTISKKIYITSVYFSWGTNVQGSSIEFYDGTTLVKAFSWPANGTTSIINATADRIVLKDNGTSNNGLGELQKITYSASAPQSSNANLSNLTSSSGTMSPAFAAATTSYSVPVANSVTSLTLTPTVADATATVKVNGVAVTSGSASGAVALNVGSNSIPVLVTAQDGTTKTYTVTVNRAAPTAIADEQFEDDVIHSSAQASPMTLDDLIYSVNAGGVGVVDAPSNGISQGTGKVMFFNYEFSGSANTFSFGSAYSGVDFRMEDMDIDVFGSDGFSSKYVVKGYKGGVNGTLVVSEQVDFHQGDNTGSIVYNKTSGAGGKLTFSSAWNAIDLIVFQTTDGQGAGAAVDNLNFSPSAQLSTNANLSNLTISSGTLSPAFAAATTSYTASVTNSISSLTVTPTVADATASVKVNGVAVTSGNASGAIALNVGSNTITVLVTAQNESTKTYTVTVTRSAPPAPQISANPANSTICVGSNTSFTVSASNATSFQWQVNSGSGFGNIANGGVYSGATTTTLTITGATALMDGFLYRCVATGATTPAANSNPASLTVNALPAITTQPEDSRIDAGAGTTFSVTATGATAYQWQVNAGSGFVNLSNTSVYSGATTATLTLNSTTSAMNGYMYRVVVTGSCSPGATSNAVSLSLRLPQTIAFSEPPSKTYGDAPFTLGNASTTEGLPVTYTAADPTVVSISGNQATILKAGTTTITATQAGNANYLPAEVTQALVVAKRAITVRAYAGQFKRYGADDVTYSYQVTSGSLVSGDAFTGKLSRVAGESVGNYAITQGTLTAGPNYVLTFVSNDFVVFKQPVTVAALPGQTKTYGATDPVLTYHITSGAVVNGDAFTGALIRASGESVNSYSITQGTLALNSNYDLTFESKDFTITKRAITVTANTGQTKVYGEADPTLTYQVTTGSMVTGDVFTGKLSRAAGEAAGTYAISLGTLSAGANYELTYAGSNFSINKRPVTVTANAGQTKVYGEADPALTYQITAGNLVTGDSFTGALSRATGEAANTYAITQGTLSIGTNYELTYAGSNFTITKRAITVTADAGQSKVYGESDPTLTYQITAGNLVAGDGFTGALGRATGEAVTNYVIIQGTLTAGINYELTYIANNFSITKRAITVTADAGQSKTYGDADLTLTYQVTTGNLITGDAFSGKLGRVAGEAVNTYAITQGTLSAGNNYALTFIANNFAISKRAITVTANTGQSKTYGEADPALTYQVTTGSLVTGDAFTGKLSRAIGESVNTYAITQGTLSANTNYEVTFQSNDFAITKRAITVTANAGQSKIYGDTDPTLTYQVTTGNLVTGDTFTGKLSRATGEAVNTYAITQGTLAAGTNYDLTYAGNNFAITKRAITVTANAGQTKVYGESDPIFTYQITTGNLVTGDAFTGALGRAAGEAVNTYAITKGTLSAGTNYELTYIANNFAITKRAITVTANAGQTKVYGEADPIFTYQITTGNLVTGDGFTGALSRVVGEAVNSYTINQGTLSAGNNYALTFIANNFAITKRAITVTANAGQSKTYGEADPTLTYTITTGNLVTGDAFTGKLSRATGESVNTYAITQGTLAAGTNYDLTYAGNNFAITKRAITVTANAGQTKIYGEADPTLTYQITTGNLVTGDAFTGKLSRATGEAVNTYAITQGTLSIGTNYELTYAGNNFAITKRAITVTANAGQTKVYGEADPIFTYQITTGNLVTGDGFTGALSRAAGDAVNTYAITQGTLAAGTNYELNYIANNFSITKRAITVTADAGQTKVYGEADPIFTHQVTTGSLVTGDAFTGNLGRVAGEAVNTYAITQGTLTAGTNYELTYAGNNFAITKRAITVTADAGQSKVYGEADPLLTYQITTGNLVTGDSFTGTLSRAVGEAVNTYAITQGTLGANTNYQLTFESNDFAITKRAITVTANAGQTKIYGEADPIFTYQVTTGNLVVGDAFTGKLSRATGEAVNTYAITQGTLSIGTNYDLTYAGNDFAITKRAITIKAKDGQTKVYGASDPEFTYQIVSGNLVESDKFTGKLSRTAGENTGTYAIGQNTLGLNANYDLTYHGNTFTVQKAALKILVDNKTRFLGTANPAFTVTYSGFVSGEDARVLSALPVMTTEASIGSSLGEYAIVAAGAEASNYEITYQNGILKVVPGAPNSVGLASVVIFENRPAGTAAGTLSSTSLDPNATFTFTLTSGEGDNDNKLFTISGNQLRTAAQLDYEQKNTYRIRVRSTTQYGFSLDQVFEVKISDVNEAPTFSAIPDETICYTTAPMVIQVTGLSSGPERNQTYELSVVSDNVVFFEQLTISNNGKLTYSVKPGMTGKTNVTVTILDNGGISNGGENSFSRTFTVTVNPLPVVAITSDKGTSISKGESVQLTASGGSSYSWADAEGITGSRKMQTLTVRPSVTATYRVQVTTADGCQAEKEITIEVKDDYQVVRGTNLVSPNGDGVNDRLIIRNIDMYPNNVVKIYDRGGRLLYSKTNYTDEWDGTFQGSPLAEGTYYYIVDFGKRQLKGFITIVRD